MFFVIILDRFSRFVLERRGFYLKQCFAASMEEFQGFTVVSSLVCTKSGAEMTVFAAGGRGRHGSFNSVFSRLWCRPVLWPISKTDSVRGHPCRRKNKATMAGAFYNSPVRRARIARQRD